MSTDQYENEAPTGQVADNEYMDRPGEKGGPVSVQSDSAKVEDPIDANTADSDEQLQKDDADAIDQSNVVDSRTRNAKPQGGYREPGDAEGLGDPEDGTSRGAAT